MQQPSMLRGIPDGVIVSDVEPSGARSPGRLINEIITRVNGKEVATPAEYYQEGNQEGPLELTLSQSDPTKPDATVTLN